MSRVTRYWLAILVGALVTVWAFWHGPFNGANLLVVAVLLAAAWVLLLWERHEDRQSRDHWLDPDHHRGDGV